MRLHWRWRWAERAGEWDAAMWRQQDEATLAARGTTPALDVAERVGDLWVGVVAGLEDYA
jgi:hypothetical protein